ncbi:MAG: superoxide dismutase [Nanoarchaeota archaeon]|nr:superoxide dismutase [Nanoarchaeota archaeon]|tara:strand:- start:1310 stop:1894 length:585 start_codon:yes stop_codon:yes gene_type:complete
MYEQKDFSHLLGTPGFSDKLLQNHFKLYAGYVTNTNKLTGTLKTMIQEGKTATPEFAELKRRFGWEFNGMRLHELYFENMSKDKKTLPEDSLLAQQMAKSLGSVQARMDTFVSVGSMRGIGWVVMYYDPVAKKLFCQWINEHDAGHLAGAVPLLVMDVFEHAFITDYGLNKAEYIKAFVNAIDWDVVRKRFGEA